MPYLPFLTEQGKEDSDAARDSLRQTDADTEQTRHRRDKDTDTDRQSRRREKEGACESMREEEESKGERENTDMVNEK